MVSCQPQNFLLLVFLLCNYFATSYAQLANRTRPEVTISQGTLQGTTLTTRKGHHISAFLGIPFAQPPIGNLRFANPVAADGWNGTFNASIDPSKCPQILSDVVIGKEDCLYINVYTPQLPNTKNSSLLPVMVYIHGGAFTALSQSSTSFGPDYLLDEDVVYAAANYRLGPLGFLSTGDEAATGNWGMKDQVLALQWIQKNIQYFGGDPDQVTIFGQSAGSACIHLLTLSNTTIGLFHRYITQSASALTTFAYRPSAPYSSLAFTLGTYVGCSNDTSDSLITCLRTVNVSDIIAPSSQFIVWDIFPDITWGPTDEPDIEGAVLTDSPSNLFATGAIRDLPWISGVVRDDGLIQTAGFYEDNEKFQYLLDNFDYLLPIILYWTYQSDSGAAWLKATKSYYFNNNLTTDKSVLLSNLTILASDSHFLYPAYNALQQHHAVAKNPQYFYTFNYRGTYSHSYIYSGSTTDYGVAHSDDMSYLSPDVIVSPDGNLNLSKTDHQMVDIMVQLWTSFAINGTPTAVTMNGTFTWEPYSTKGNYLRIGNNSDPALEVQYSFFKDRMQFWTSIDTIAEEEKALSDESGSVTSSPNLILLLVITCGKFFLPVVTTN